jgi:hypothetical protein
MAIQNYASNELSMEAIVKTMMQIVKGKKGGTGIYMMGALSSFIFDSNYSRKSEDEIKEILNDFLRHYVKTPDEAKLLQLFMGARADNGNPDAKDFLMRIGLSAAMIVRDNKALKNDMFFKVFLNNLEKFQDKKLVADVLRRINGSAPTKEYKRDALTLLANNPNVTTQDLRDLQYFEAGFLRINNDKLDINQFNKMMLIANDAQALARKELSDELQKDIPNIDAMEGISRCAINVYLYIKDNVINIRDAYKQENLISDALKNARAEFDIDKLVGGNGAEYIRKTTEDIAQLRSDNGKLRESLKESKARADRYAKLYEDEVQRGQEKSSEFSTVTTYMKKMISGLDKVESGIGSKNVKKYKADVLEMAKKLKEQGLG